MLETCKRLSKYYN